MEKKDLFSKLNIKKNYNNIVEEILEEKDFSENIKNLILSMFYQIEISYNDYNKVKTYAEPKQKYIEELIENLKNSNYKIELKKPVEDEKIDITDAELKENNIITYPNKNSLLYAIFLNDKKNFNISSNYELLEEPFKEFLNISYCIDNTEVIRDFDGWSWNINLKEEKLVRYNLLYQNIQILIGNKLFENWKKDEDTIVDYIEKLQLDLEEIYGEDVAKKIFFLICQNILIIHYDSNEKIKKASEKTREISTKKEKIKDKTEYLKIISEQKKNYISQMKKLEETLQNKEKLEQEFIKIHEQKSSTSEIEIFSLSKLTRKINLELMEIKEKIEECNAKLDPRIYNIKIENINKELEIAKVLEEYKEQNMIDLITKLQNEFLRALRIKIEKLSTKKEILNEIYNLRYYRFLPITKEKSIKDMQTINTRNLQKLLITKACNDKIVTIINKNIELNFEIIQKILDSKIVNLEEIEIILDINGNDLEIEIYEGEILESKKKTEISEEKKDFNVKFQKKFKLFN